MWRDRGKGAFSPLDSSGGRKGEGEKFFLPYFFRSFIPYGFFFSSPRARCQLVRRTLRVDFIFFSQRFNAAIREKTVDRVLDNGYTGRYVTVWYTNVECS